MEIAFFVDGKIKGQNIIRENEKENIEDYLEYRNFLKIEDENYAKYVAFYKDSYYKLDSKQDFILLSPSYGDYKRLKKKKKLNYMNELMLLTAALLLFYPRRESFFVVLILFLIQILKGEI